MASKTNRVEVPEAKAAMDRFKTEVASELGVNLKEGYNGDLTSKEAGSIGGEMVRRMSKQQLRQYINPPPDMLRWGIKTMLPSTFLWSYPPVRLQ